MTRYDIYTIAGSGSAGTAGNGGLATSANLNGPGNATVDSAGNLYITDTANNRVQEVPVASGVQWGQAMTANYMYTVAGSASGTAGSSGDGGPATSAQFTVAENVSLDPEGDLYITDHNNDRLREVVSSTPATIAPSSGLTSALSPAPGGITVTQPDGSQVTFYAKSGGSCGTAPYTQAAGQYCVLPQDIGASLTISGGNYTFTQQPGTAFTYNSAGQLAGEQQTDSNGTVLNSLTISSATPAPGSGDCPAAAVRCNTITSASGRALVVGLNQDTSGNFLVSSVTDPMSRRWTYSYTGDDLTSVTDPSGQRVTTYSYDSGNADSMMVNDMLTITEPNAQVGGPDAGDDTALTYDSSGRVTSATDPMNFETTYTWTGYNPSTGTGNITVGDPDGNKAVYYYVQGSLAAQSQWTGTTLNSEQDMVPDQTITSGDNSAGTQLATASADGTAISPPTATTPTATPPLPRHPTASATRPPPQPRSRRHSTRPTASLPRPHRVPAPPAPDPHRSRPAASSPRPQPRLPRA